MDYQLRKGERLVKLQDDGRTSATKLFANFREMIAKAEETRSHWNPRAVATLDKAITVLRQYADGVAGTPDVKAQFAALGMLGGTECLMTDVETYAVYCVTEVCHAAAHMGHYVMAHSRKGLANQEYARVHKSYVKMGLQLAMRYYRMVQQATKTVDVSQLRAAA